MTVTEQKTIKILAGFSGEHCIFSKLVTPKVILSYLWVSVSQRQKNMYYWINKFHII